MSKFVLSVLLLCLLLLSACNPQPELKFSDLPPGDAAQGERLFNQSINTAPACAGCHLLDGMPSDKAPSLAGFARVAASRKPGLSAGDYALESITKPATSIVGGFSNTMYTQYGRLLTLQNLADLIAYLLTLD